MPAIVVASLISAGAQVTGQVLNNRAAGKASRTQADAAREAAQMEREANDKAIAAQREQEAYNRQRQAAQDASRAPYVQAQNQSLAALSQALNLPKFDPTGKPPMMQPTGPFAPPSLDGYQVNPGMGQPGQPSRQLQSQQPVRVSLADYGQQAGMGGTVRLIAPDGSQRDVPAERAEYFIQRGARRAS